MWTWPRLELSVSHLGDAVGGSDPGRNRCQSDGSRADGVGTAHIQDRCKEHTMPGPYRTYAEAGMAALMGWYDPACGLWQTSGWWNAANALAK